MKKSSVTVNWHISAILAAPLLLITVGFICYKSALPFQVENIRPTRYFSFQRAQTVSQERLEEIRVLFAQPFVYLREGDQFYEFLSKDKIYVIKFFKVRKFTPKYWLNYIPLPWLAAERLNKVENRERVRQEVFGNFNLAFKKFRYQTGLFYIHLFCTDFLKIKADLVDQQNLFHEVDLDRVPFILQRMPTSLSEHINRLAQKDKQTGKEGISALLLILDLVKDRCQRGLADQDGELESEYGFIGDRPVFIDVGVLVRDESLKGRFSMLREVFKVSQKIERWLEENHPSFIPEFQKGVDDLIASLEEI